MKNILLNIVRILYYYVVHILFLAGSVIIHNYFVIIKGYMWSKPYDVAIWDHSYDFPIAIVTAILMSVFYSIPCTAFSLYRPQKSLIRYLKPILYILLYIIIWIELCYETCWSNIVTLGNTWLPEEVYEVVFITPWFTILLMCSSVLLTLLLICIPSVFKPNPRNKIS